jgi:hypothetical protein
LSLVGDPRHPVPPQSDCTPSQHKDGTNVWFAYSGETLSISAEGYLKEDIEDGAKVHIQVKYGVITLINQETDLCEQTKNVDLECPLEKGALKLTKDVELPKEIPPVC